MFSPFERLLAFRYLRAKKAEGFVSVIAGFSFTGIMLGVATLIIVMAVMNGFRAELFSRILGINGHMSVYALQGQLTDYEGITNKIRNLNGVSLATPIIEAQTLVSHNGTASGAMVRGISWEDFQNRDILKNAVKGGTLDNFTGAQVAIGQVLADKLKLRVGDDIILTSPTVKSTPFGSMPRQRKYKIGLTFDVGMYEYNNGYIFMPLDTAQVFFQYKGAVSAIEVMLDDPSAIDQMRDDIAVITAGRAGVYDWRDTNASFFNALQVERNVMFLILTMIILVAAFNIISSMIMLVKDKTHDIAILRTMGATRRNMLKIFMLTGASIGVMGTTFGAALGIAFAMNIEAIRRFLEGLTGTELFADEIYFLSQLPAKIEWHEVMVVVLMAFTLSILATIYPAYRAARLDPVQALRYE